MLFSRDRRKIKARLCDFPPSLNARSYYVFDILGRYFDIDLDSTDPEWVFFGFSGLEHLNYPKAKKVFIAVEDCFPDFRICDFAVSFAMSELLPFGRHLYHNNSLNYFETSELFGGLERLEKNQISATNRDQFAAFIASNPNSVRRVELAAAMQEVGPVDYPGRYKNNTGEPLAYGTTGRFLQRYRFNICGENAHVPGYHTEKLLQAILAGCVPVYTGDPSVFRFFNKDRVVFAGTSDFATAVEQVSMLERDASARLAFLNQRIFANKGDLPDYLLEAKIADFFRQVFFGWRGIIPKGRRKPNEIGYQKGLRRRVMPYRMCKEEWNGFLKARRRQVKLGNIDRRGAFSPSERAILAPPGQNGD